MREIKLRAWNGEEMISPDFISRDGYAHWNENSIPERTKEIMQYTGLKDKNGKEIYEGDIVRMPFYGITVIVWNEDIGSFQYSYHAIAGKGVTNTLYKYESKKKYEVIGNIYEHPELIQNKSQLVK